MSTTDTMKATNSFTAALEEVLDAADHWRDELEEYIAPAAEECNDVESAQQQRTNALDIDRASALLWPLVHASRCDRVEGADGMLTFKGKANLGFAALNAYRVVCGERAARPDDVESVRTSVVDLLADLGHWASVNDLDMQALLDEAAGHVEAEAGRCFLCGGPVAKVGEAQVDFQCEACAAA